MKFEIVCNDSKKEEAVVRLKLVPGETTHGGVTLRAVDTAGNNLPAGNILNITEDGKLRIISGCKVDGINTDIRGCIMVE